MDINNIDSKGVKRGACLLCEECTNFEWRLGATNSSCQYCGCLPVKHHKFTASEPATIAINNLQPEEPSGDGSQKVEEIENPATKTTEQMEINEKVKFSKIIFM